MFITISLLLSLSIILLILFIISSYKRNQMNLGSTWFIIFSVSFLLTVILVLYFFLLESENSFESFRYILISTTSIIALVSLLISSFLSRQTIKLHQNTQKMSKNNQDVSFVMDLIKNNYQLLKDKENNINNLILSLDADFIGKSFFFNEIASRFHNFLKSRQSSFPIDTIQTGSRNGNKNFKKLENILLKDGEDDSYKLLVVYFSLNEEKTSHIFKLLSPSIQNKVSGNETFLKFAQETVNIEQYIEEFLAQSEIIDLMGRDISTLTFEQIKPVMEKIFNEHYDQIGHFFRNSYRVVKFINQLSKNEKNEDLNFRKTYLGILRSYYSENVLIAIYYNSIFTNKGLGYSQELACSDFFGDETDLTNDDPIHVRKDRFYFGSKDLKTIKKLFISAPNDSTDTTTNPIDIQSIKTAFDRA